MKKKPGAKYVAAKEAITAGLVTAAVTCIAVFQLFEIQSLLLALVLGAVGFAASSTLVWTIQKHA